MSTVLDIDVASDDVSVVLGELISKPAHLDCNLETLRQGLYRQGGVDRRHAAEIFHANRIMKVRHDGWSEFYLDAMAGFFVEYQHDSYVLPVDAESILIGWLGDGVSIDHPNERRLTLRILLRAANIPDRLELRVVKAVKENLLHRSERWLGVGERCAGSIDALDMQMIRRLVQGAGGQYPRRSSHAVVTFLFSLEQHAKQFMAPREWRHMLINCVARHLTMDPENGSETTLAPHVALKAWIKPLLDEGYSSEKAACLQDDILSTMRLVSDHGDQAPTVQPSI